MRGILLSVLVAALSVVCSMPVYASSLAHQQLVAKVIELDGSDKIFDSIPTAFDALAAGEQLVAKKTDQDKDPAASSLFPQFDLAAAKKDFSQYLSDHADDTSLAAVLSWLQTPLGKRLADEESLVSGGEHQAEILVFLAQLKSSPPPKARVELIQRFVDESHAAELQVKMMKGLVLAMTAPLAETVPELSAQKFRNLVDAKETGMLDAARRQVILNSFYTYRSFSDDELEQYIAFVKTDEYKRFSQSYVGALEAGLTTTFSSLGKKLADLAGSKKSGEAAGGDDGDETCSE